MSAAVVGVVLAAATLAAWTATRAYVRETCAPGRQSPPAPAALRRAAVAFVRALVFVQVGPIRTIGRESFTALDGPCVIAANHGHYADGPVVAFALGVPPRTHYFVARGALAWGRGLVALVFGPSQTVSVDLREGQGGAALRTGVRLLAAGERIVLFPEGWAHMDGAPAAFKPGAVWMAARAGERLGRPVPIVPVAVTYPRHPGSWITRFSPSVQYVVTFLAFPFFRRGVTVSIGDPLWPSALSADPHEATRVLEATIRDLTKDA